MSADSKIDEMFRRIKMKYIRRGCMVLLFVNMLVQAIIGNAFSALLNLFLFWFVVWYDARSRARGQL